MVLSSDGLILLLFHCLLPRHRLQMLLTLSYSAHFYFQVRKVHTPSKDCFHANSKLSNLIRLSVTLRKEVTLQRGQNGFALAWKSESSFSQSFLHTVYLSGRDQIQTIVETFFWAVIRIRGRAVLQHLT